VYTFEPKPEPGAPKDAISRVQEGTSLLAYDEDEHYSHIRVDAALASRSLTKPWVPTCPTNCYTLLTKKGVFASYRDLYQRNLSSDARGDRGKAMRLTLDDIASASLRFDHVLCVACGTCGAIGPPEMVEFGHERSGHGVRYKFG
jgi:electron transfer flavoprotein-quinone oxidoreductase